MKPLKFFLCMLSLQKPVYLIDFLRKIIKIKSIQISMILQSAKQFQSPICWQGEHTKRNSTRPNSFEEQIPFSPRSAFNNQLQKNDFWLENSSDQKKESVSSDQIIIFGQKIEIDYKSEQSVSEVIQQIEENAKIKERTKLGLQMVVLKRGLEKNKRLAQFFEASIQKYQKELLNLVN